MNSKEENSCPNYVQEFGLWTILVFTFNPRYTYAYSIFMLCSKLGGPPLSYIDISCKTTEGKNVFDVDSGFTGTVYWQGRGGVLFDIYYFTIFFRRFFLPFLRDSFPLKIKKRILGG